MQFSDFKLREEVLRAISEQGYDLPTGIQEKAIPLILNGQDIIGHSQTGSGKTAAFGLPIINQLQGKQGIRVLVLTPTRELCMQVCDALKSFSKHLRFNVVPVFGGVGIGPQLGALRTADIVVATPGRLLDVMERGVKLSGVKHLVLDEADRMLDMGFIDDVEKILRATPKDRQTLLFSATLSPKLRGLVNKYMKSPVSVEAKVQVDSNLLSERVYEVSVADKFSLLVHCLKHETPGIAIVFCKTRHGCDKVARKLRSQQIDAIAIHGGLSQNKRIDTINRLHKRGVGILVATDVASRGLHIDNISHVYNFDLPQVSDDYVHRIGRTARAGAKGDAVTFITPHDVRDFRAILRELGRQVYVAQMPEFEKVVVSPADERDSERRDGRDHHRSRFGGGRSGGRGGGHRGRGFGGGRGGSRGGFKPRRSFGNRGGDRSNSN
jgi:superfamily II DNA/RNA helicase